MQLPHDVRPGVEWLDVSCLSLDRQNPRLAEFGLTAATTDTDIVAWLWKTMDVRELVMSITASGFLSHEPLIVTKDDGKYVVIEGNRRLAAVNLLLDGELAKRVGASVPNLGQEEAARLARLPAVIDTRQDAWRHLGFKHINGPAKWSSYAKSRYVATVHHEYGISLDDIARQIGDTHRTVRRLYRGLMVIEQARDAGVFSIDDRWSGHFSFSHLYTGLEHSGIRDFLGLNVATMDAPNPVPRTKLEELGKLCRWMYGDKTTPPVIRRQNPDLKHLANVVADDEALAALGNGTSLDDSFELSRPSSRVLLETLVAAKQKLQKARGLVSTGYDGSKEPIQIAGTAATIADHLYEDMERRRGVGKKRQYTEAG